MAAAFGWTGFIDTDLDFSEFFGGNHTISLRFMPQVPFGYEGPFVAENGTGTFVLGQGTATWDETAPHLYLGVASQILITQVKAIQTGLWYHLAMIGHQQGSQRTFTLFLNGIPISQQITVDASARDLPKGKVRFGKRTTGRTVNERNAQFYGFLADVAFFDAMLSESAINTLAKKETQLTGNEPNLVAGYRFRDGPPHARLSRPFTVHGEASVIATSADWNAVKDFPLLPLPRHHQPMDLPFAPGEAWRAGQTWNSSGSHHGLAAFAWDLTRVGSAGTEGAPVYATAPGRVETARNDVSPGSDAYNLVDLEQAAGEYASYVHLQKGGVEVSDNEQVTLGQKLALAGNTGTEGSHLHFAVNDKPDGDAGFVTIPVAFSDYEVQDGLAWKPVARGIPRDEEVIRIPPTPTFGARSLHPGSLVSRGADRLDLVATDTAGGVWVARWAPKRYVRNWDRWRRVLADIGPARPAGVASRSSNRLDVVVADAAGFVQTGGWGEHVNSGVWGGWWRIRDLIGRPDGSVGIVSRGSKKLDVFAVRLDGRILGAAWDADVQDGAWRGWWFIQSGLAQPGAPVTAVSRHPDKLDLFVVGLDGGIYTAAWEQHAADGEWRGWWRIGDARAPQGSTVSAVARDPDKLDVFVVDTNGRIVTAAWDHHAANGEWQGWWQIKGGTTRPGGPVTAVSRDANKLDVFVVDTDFGVYTAAWDRKVADGQWRGWWRVRDLAAAPGTAVAAVSRHPDKLDICCVRLDGQMSTAAYDRQKADGEWQGWWRIG